MNKELDLNLLPIFCAVVETESMSDAAESLGINQSTVSVAMRKLKDILQTELFIRKSKGVVPTAAGKALYSEISTDLTRIYRRISGLGHFDPMNSARKFSVSCLELSNHRLLRELRYPNNPDLQIHLYGQPSSSEALLKSVIERERDLFIDVTVPDHPSIVAVPLMNDRSCVIASANHPRLKSNKITLEQFLQEPYVKLERTRNQQAGISLLTKAQMHSLNVVSYTNSMFESMITVSQTDLISTLPISMAREYQQLLNLQCFELPFSSSPIDVFMIWHKTMDGDLGHKWLRDRVLSIYQQ